MSAIVTLYYTCDVWALSPFSLSADKNVLSIEVEGSASATSGTGCDLQLKSHDAEHLNHASGQHVLAIQQSEVVLIDPLSDVRARRYNRVHGPSFCHRGVVAPLQQPEYRIWCMKYHVYAFQRLRHT